VRTDTVALAVDGRGSVDGFDDAGVYRWTATAFESAADSTAAVATGAVVVQPDGAELRAARDLALPDDVAALAGSRVRARGGDTPLRDHPAPWIALVLMLSTEWVGRRRSGLR
jgi:hypothetical protein